MRLGSPPPQMANKQDRCECGSGYMPTLMEQRRNRWACLKCYMRLPANWPNATAGCFNGLHDSDCRGNTVDCRVGAGR